MPFHRILPIFLLLICLFLLSSGRHRDDVPEQKYLNLARQPQFASVGAVYQDKECECSAVLISERYVVTAAHCLVEGFNFKPVSITQKDGSVFRGMAPTEERPASPEDFYFLFGGKKYKASRFALHPAYLDSLTNGQADIALVELEKPVKGIEPATLYTTFDELHAQVTGVGYGTTGKGSYMYNVGEKIPFGRLAGHNVIDSIGGYLENGVPAMLLCDFDHPTDPSCNKMGSPVPLPLEYIADGGDSGGGLFRQQNGQWQLVGIYEGGGAIDVPQLRRTGMYGSIMMWTRVSAYANWISAEMK